MSYFLLHFAMADPVIDQEKKSYRWIWVPVNDAGEMRFFILSRMYPVSFKFDFWWIWKSIETFFLPYFPFYFSCLTNDIVFDAVETLDVDHRDWKIEIQ